MSREFLWGCELNETNREYEWGNDNFVSSQGMSFSLLLKEIVLGAESKNEINVVELETEGWDLTVIRQPLVILKPISMQQKSLDILIANPGSKFILSKGSGPVYLWGQRVIELKSQNDDLSSVADESTVLDDDIEEQAIETPEKLSNEKVDSENEEASNTDDSDSPLRPRKATRSSGSRLGKAKK